jgi:sodium/potassium-transporting ATPase subunit alpha
MNDAVSGTEAIRTWDDHMIGIEKLAGKLDTDAYAGLTAGSAAAKHSENGENALTKKEVVPWYCVFFHEMTGFFSLLLWFGSALCFIGYAI